MLAQLGIDPQNRERKIMCDDLVFRFISISEMEAKLPFRDPRIDPRKFRVLLIGVDHVDVVRRELIQKIREHLPTLFGHAVEAVLSRAPSDEQEFCAHAKDPSIMIGEDGGGFDGKSWSMAFSWGKGTFGYHVEFVDLELIEVWGGD
ncbi:MAG: hypothetical protein ABIQ96_12345 [Luteolibacter sp.]